MDNESRVKIDLIVIGNPNSGKTSLVRRFIEGQTSFSHFYNPTLGLSLEKKIIRIDKTEVTVCIWDTAGQQKFFSLTKNYFKRADGVLVVYDITDKNSFDRIEQFWMQEIKDKSDQYCSQILIGNKLDISHQRSVQTRVGEELASRLQIDYFQTSAKTGQGVQAAITALVKLCLGKVRQDQKRGSDVNLDKLKTKHQNRCFNASKEFFDHLLMKFR